MAELDLTEAIEAAAIAIDAERDIDVNPNRLADAAVRAAAPIIERAVREARQRDVIGYRVPAVEGWRVYPPSDVEIIYLDREAK